MVDQIELGSDFRTRAAPNRPLKVLLPSRLKAFVLLVIQEAAAGGRMGQKDDAAIAPLLDRPDDIAELANWVSSESIDHFGRDNAQTHDDTRIYDFNLTSQEARAHSKHRATRLTIFRAALLVLFASRKTLRGRRLINDAIELVRANAAGSEKASDAAAGLALKRKATIVLSQPWRLSDQHDRR
jgi:hypothetical protein